MTPNYLGSLQQPQEEKKPLVTEPTITTVLTIFGWLMIFGGPIVAMIILMVSPATSTVDWSVVIGAVFTGMMFLVVAAILRSLARIERAIRELKR